MIYREDPIDAPFQHAHKYTFMEKYIYEYMAEN